MMLESQALIQRYELLAKLMREMLGAARLQDWDRVTALETFYATQVDRLKVQEEGVMLKDEDKYRKSSIIKAMLADDKEIRALLDPWMARLSQLVHVTHKEAKLNRSYGA